MMTLDNKKRCFGDKKDREFYADYHDNEWGKPSHDDQHLFEMLVLEGQQAGLSWETILKKRKGYREVFYNFDPVKVAGMTDGELEALRHNTKIIRNRLKINSVRKNAKAFLTIQQEFGSFDSYVWGFVNNKTIQNQRRNFNEMPTSTTESVALSKDLKKRGMTFVGPTIIYAFMQAVGMVNDHLIDCWRFDQ